MLVLSFLLGLTVVPAKAETTLRIISDPTSIETNNGNSISIPLSIDSNPGGIDSFAFYAFYKAAALTPKTENSAGTVFAKVEANYEISTDQITEDNVPEEYKKAPWSAAYFSCPTSDAVTTDGLITTLNFDVKSDVETCTVEICYVVVEAVIGDDDVCADVPVAKTTVVITGATPTLDGGTVSLFTDADRKTAHTGDITVHGSVDSANQYLYAKAVSKGGTIITNDVNWKVTPADQGVTVDATGKVTIGCNAVAETSGTTYTVKAEGKGGSTSAGSGEVTFTVKRDPAAVQSIAIYRGDSKLTGEDGTGSATIIIPASDTAGDNTYTYTVKSTDQYGDEADVGSPTWTFTPTVVTDTTYVTFANGTVTVKFGATPDNTYTLKAESGGKEATVTLTAKNIDITWPTSCTDGKTGTYGQTWQQIVNFSSAGGSAKLDNSPVYGTFTLKNSGTKPAVTDPKYTVNFTSTDGQYNVDKEFTATISPRDISNATIGTIAAETYDGTQKKPTPTVTDSGATITADDYTVSYENNINAGNATVKLTGKNNYTGEKTATFKINSAAITLKDPVAVDAIYANNSSNDTLAALTAYVQSKNAKIQSSDGVVTFNATWSTTDSHVRTGKTYTFTAALSNPTRTLDDTGNYDLPAKAPTVTVEVKPVTATQTIAAANASITLSKAAIEALTDEASMKTALKLPTTVSVTYDPSSVTTPNTFAISGWDKDVAALKAEAAKVTGNDSVVTVKLTPVYAAADASGAPEWATLAAKPQFTLTIINKNPIPNEDITFDDQTITYGGTYTPGATVASKLEYTNVEYTYSYAKEDGTALSAEPTDAGVYVVTVTAQNDDYMGTKTAKLTIRPKSIADGSITAELAAADQSVVYKKAAYEPLPTVTDSAIQVEGADKVLVKDTDYTVSYSNNVNKGTAATVTITGKGNYDSATTKAVTFEITARELTTDNTTITGVSASYPFSGSAIAPKVNVTETVTGTLAETTDYTLGYSGNTNAGTATITVTGNGNYSGSVTKTFEITKVALTGVVSVKLKTDNGTAGTIDTGDILTADVSKLSETTGANLTYQWYRGETAIDGATNQDYTLTDDDVSGSKISVKVAANNDSNYTGTVASDSVTVAAKPMPTDVSVSISVTKEGDTIKLTATVTVASGAGATEVSTIVANFAVQWYRNGAAAGSPVAITSDDGNTLNPVAYNGTIEGGDVLTCALVPKAGAEETYTGSIPASSSTIDSSASGDAGGTTGNVEITASAPAAPTVTATAGNGTVTVNWTPGSTNGSTVLNWTVTCTDGVTTRTETVDLGKTSFTFNGLTNNTEYTFTVKANISGGSGDTGTVKATPKAPTPPVGPTDPTTPTYPGTGSGSGSSSSDDDDDTVTIRSSSRDHGTVRLSSSSARKGDTVTVTVKPDRGYEVDEVLVYSSNGTRLDVRSIGGDEYTFTMPSGTVRVEVTYKRTGSTAQSGFNDVPSTYWAADAIRWVSENGYMMGNTAVTFNPEGRITRQQMWMIMARMAGSNPYDFSDARAWAIANGISDGSNPGNSVTRQQMVAILYRYAQMMDYRTTGGTDLSAFPDSGSVASYAQEALQWSVGNGIVGGTASGTLNPGGTATRAQFATILQRFYANVAR